MLIRRRKSAFVRLVAACTAAMPMYIARAAETTWLGGTFDWNYTYSDAAGTHTNWTGDMIPGAGDDATINSGMCTVFTPIPTAIHNLALGAAGQLWANSDASGFHVTGDIDNDGTFLIGGSTVGGSVGIFDSGGTTTLSGAGRLQLFRGRLTTGFVNPSTLIINDVGHTIEGVGTIELPLLNRGLIQARQTTPRSLNLVVSSAGVSNQGILRAVDSGTLVIGAESEFPALNNANGTIQAGAGGTVSFGNAPEPPTISGGTLEALNFGAIRSSPVNLNNVTLRAEPFSDFRLGNAWMQDCTITSGSHISVENKGGWGLVNSLTNNGQVDLGSGATLFADQGPVIVQGSGTISLSNGTISGSTLTNGPSHTIQATQGSGLFQVATLHNEGLIQGSDGQSIFMGGDVTNDGAIFAQANSFAGISGNYAGTGVIGGDGIFFMGFYKVSGTVTKVGNGTLYTTPSYNAAASQWTLHVTAGVLDDSGRELGQPGMLNTTVQIDSSAAIFHLSEHLASLTVTNGSVDFTETNTRSAIVTHSVVTTGSGAIDLGSNSAIIDYSETSPLASIGSQIKSGYANGSWTGPGIRSSSAAADPNHRALGFAEASDLFTAFPATFAGESVDSTAVLVRYTLTGDANLDATVDTVDFNLLAASFSQSGKYWFNGEFNYDSTVDTLDFNLLASNFGQTLAAETGGPSGLVPEPTSAALTLLLLQRRRRH